MAFVKIENRVASINLCKSLVNFSSGNLLDLSIWILPLEGDGPLFFIPLQRFWYCLDCALVLGKRQGRQRPKSFIRHDGVIGPYGRRLFSPSRRFTPTRHYVANVGNKIGQSNAGFRIRFGTIAWFPFFRRKDTPVSNGEEEHFQANQDVLNFCGLFADRTITSGAGAY